MAIGFVSAKPLAYIQSSYNIYIGPFVVHISMIHDSWSSRTLGMQSKRILNNDAVPAIDVAGIVEPTEEIMTE